MKKITNASWFIPLLALWLIFLVAMVTLCLSKQRVPEKKEEVLTALRFVPANLNLKKGETWTVAIKLRPPKPLSLDGVDVVLEFDPSLVEIKNIVMPKLFSFFSQNKINEEKGRVALTFLEEKEGGLKIENEVLLSTITILAKKSGKGEIKILSAEEGPTTVITETSTSRQIPFKQENLKVVIF